LNIGNKWLSGYLRPAKNFGVVEKCIWLKLLWCLKNIIIYELNNSVMCDMKVFYSAYEPSQVADCLEGMCFAVIVLFV